VSTSPRTKARRRHAGIGLRQQPLQHRQAEARRLAGPVCAAPITSPPLSTTGIAFAWIGRRVA